MGQEDPHARPPQYANELITLLCTFYKILRFTDFLKMKLRRGELKKITLTLIEYRNILALYPHNKNIIENCIIWYILKIF